MQCPKCRFENPDDAKFCMECGKQLTAATPEFEKPVVGAERKHATVLFCDLAGYTALTEKLDPEVVKEIMGRIFAEAAWIIETYEGTVERFFGDEIMALFGVPKAHEDDPLRAIRAARAIHESVAGISCDYEKQIGRVLRMHSGINTGLMVTGDEYIGNSPQPSLRPWRDTHVEVCGPAVLGIQLAFIEDWYWMTTQIPAIRTEPVRTDDADQRILVLPSGPADVLDTCWLLFIELINSARRRLWVVSPYFVPDDAVVSALQLAALRGVDVRIMLPQRAEHLLVHLAKFSYLEEALPVGIRFFCYEQGFLHQKAILVDDNIAGIGTANLDNRSFRLNFEITLLFVDQQCVEDVETMLEADFSQCREMTLDEIQRRGFWFRLATRIARLFSPVL